MYRINIKKSIPTVACSFIPGFQHQLMKVAPVVPVFQDWCKEFAWKLVKNWWVRD